MLGAPFLTLCHPSMRFEVYIQKPVFISQLMQMTVEEEVNLVGHSDLLLSFL